MPFSLLCKSASITIVYDNKDFLLGDLTQCKPNKQGFHINHRKEPVLFYSQL